MSIEKADPLKTFRAPNARFSTRRVGVSRVCVVVASKAAIVSAAVERLYGDTQFYEQVPFYGNL